MSDKDKEEAGSVVEAIEFDNWDDIELAEKRFVRKVDLWVLPFLTIIYILNFVGMHLPTLWCACIHQT